MTNELQIQTALTSDIRPLTSALIPLPELPITVRLGTIDDIPFIDELQKKQTKNLGFMHRGTLEGKVKLGEVLIAESVSRESLIVSREEGEDVDRESLIVDRKDNSDSVRSTTNDQRPTLAQPRLTTNDQRPTKLGYLIGNDRYFKRDELGAIFQLCVVPNKQRGLIGATLLKALFERASYGCKLYCCWCAKDLEANHFWEAMGFVPIAFRSGSRTKMKDANGKRVPRVHIFWQKRIRAGDNATPWWFPSQTGGGAIGEDRIVLPIPPGVHWSEVESVVLPGAEVVSRESLIVDREEVSDQLRLTTNDQRSTRAKRPKKSPTIAPPVKSSTAKSTIVKVSAARFGSAIVEPVNDPSIKKEKPKREKVKVEKKNDPKLVKAARELRDRYLEAVNSDESRAAFAPVNAKYDVARMIEGTGEMCALPMLETTKLLAA